MLNEKLLRKRQYSMFLRSIGNSVTLIIEILARWQDEIKLCSKHYHCFLIALLIKNGMLFYPIIMALNSEKSLYICHYIIFSNNHSRLRN